MLHALSRAGPVLARPPRASIWPRTHPCCTFPRCRSSRRAASSRCSCSSSSTSSNSSELLTKNEVAPDDVCDEVAAHLDILDLCRLAASSKGARSAVEASLERRYGRVYDAYCRCTTYTQEKRLRTLLRFAAPQTLRPWAYVCAGCGRPQRTVGSCPFCFLRRLSLEHRRRRCLELQDVLVDVSVASLFLAYFVFCSQVQSTWVHLWGVLAATLLVLRCASYTVRQFLFFF